MYFIITLLLICPLYDPDSNITNVLSMNRMVLSLELFVIQHSSFSLEYNITRLYPNYMALKALYHAIPWCYLSKIILIQDCKYTDRLLVSWVETTVIKETVSVLWIYFVMQIVLFGCPCVHVYEHRQTGMQCRHIQYKNNTVPYWSPA